MAIQPISVFLRSSVVSKDEMASIISAINNTSMPAFAKVWGTQGELIWDQPAGAWSLWVMDGNAPAGDLAFHISQGGVPVMEIFPRTIALAGASLCQCIDHEVKEALVDPTAGTILSWPGGNIVKEVCDPVSEDAIDLGDGLMGASFVYPLWFTAGSEGPWDARGLCEGAGHIRPGGYVEQDVGGRWQLTAMRNDEGKLNWRLGQHGRLAYRARNR